MPVSNQKTVQVDFLSFQFEELDLYRSWQYATKHKSMANGRRLENASWRKFFQMRFNLKKSNPLIIEWLKDSDCCWLYGPFHAFEPIKELEAKYESNNPTTKGLKPVLKKPNDTDEFSNVLEQVYREFRAKQLANQKTSPTDLMLSLRSSPIKRTKPCQPNYCLQVLRTSFSLPDIFKGGDKRLEASLGPSNKLSDSRTGSTTSQTLSRKNLRFNMAVEQRSIILHSTYKSIGLDPTPLFGPPARAKLQLEVDDDSDSGSDDDDICIHVIPKGSCKNASSEKIPPGSLTLPKIDSYNRPNAVRYPAAPTSPIDHDVLDPIASYQNNANVRVRMDLQVDIPLGQPPSPNMSPEELDEFYQKLYQVDNDAPEEEVESIRVLHALEASVYQKYLDTTQRARDIVSNAWELGGWLARVPRNAIGNWI